MDDQEITIREPFYSDGFRGWRIEASNGKGWEDSIVVYNYVQCAAVLQIANSQGWYAAKRYERDINIKRQADAEAERERSRSQQQQSPR